MSGSIKSPCLNCKDQWRKEINGKMRDCHTDCERYKEYVARNEELKERRRKKKNIAYLGYIEDRVIRKRKSERGK